jgi:hypothetical protein
VSEKRRRSRALLLLLRLPRPCLASHARSQASCFVNRVRKSFCGRLSFLLSAPTELATCQCACVCSSHVPLSSTCGDRSATLLLCYTRRRDRSRRGGSFSVSLVTNVPFAAPLSSLAYHSDCMHSRLGEQASEAPSFEIRFLGSISARLLVLVRVLPR